MGQVPASIWRPTPASDVTTDNQDVVRITQDGDTRITQDGDTRILNPILATKIPGTVWENDNPSS